MYNLGRSSTIDMIGNNETIKLSQDKTSNSTSISKQQSENINLRETNINVTALRCEEEKKKHVDNEHYSVPVRAFLVHDQLTAIKCIYMNPVNSPFPKQFTVNNDSNKISNKTFPGCSSCEYHGQGCWSTRMIALGN